MKKTIATIADVENALLAFQVAVELDANLEAQSGKKLAAVVEALTPKDGVTKDLNHAYTNAEKWWSVNAHKGKEDCTNENELQMIEARIRKSDAYDRHFANADTKEKVELWFAGKFLVDSEEEEKAA